MKENKIPKSQFILTAGRNGLSKDLIDYFVQSNDIQEIIYIACNRKSMNRDLGVIKLKYKLVKSIIMDEFPNTEYNNTILFLKRNE